MSRKKVIIFLCLFCVFILLFGCTKKNANDNEEKIPKDTNTDKKQNEIKLTVKDLYPLNEGDYWKFSGKGNEYAAFEQKVLFREGDRIQLKVATGGTVMAMIYEFKDGELAVVYSEEEFYEEENILDRENEMSLVILKEPIKEGNSWTSGGRTYKIESTTTTVNTPAGEFKNCIKISHTGEEENTKSYVYYKPGLGLIKQEYIGEDYEIIAELEKYNVSSVVE